MNPSPAQHDAIRQAQDAYWRANGALARIQNHIQIVQRGIDNRFGHPPPIAWAEVMAYMRGAQAAALEYEALLQPLLAQGYSREQVLVAKVTRPMSELVGLQRDFARACAALAAYHAPPVSKRTRRAEFRAITGRAPAAAVAEVG